jgi:uncharacterized protein (TIGR03032 family)
MLKNQGSAILLRQTTPDDAPIICQAYQNKAFLRLFAAHRKVPKSETELRRNLQKRSQISPETLHYIEWLIIHKRHGAIGIAALNDYSQNPPHAEFLIGLFQEQNCHLGYGIAATLLALDLAFNHLNLEKIYSLVYDYNPIAGQILTKGDFKPEGLQKTHHQIPQENRLVALHRFGLTVEHFRHSQILCRLSRKLLDRDITQSAISPRTAKPKGKNPIHQMSTPQSASHQNLPPLSCTYTPEFLNILSQLGCTLVLSTYQAGKVILLSVHDNKLIQLPRTFNKPMGLAVDGHRLAVATQEEVIVLANALGLATAYPKQPNTYDALYLPQATYYSGELDIHDMAYGVEGLWAVNTRFSCLSLIDDHYSFTPRWMPSFISRLTPDDCCHLNGLAMQAGKPRYVTALGNSHQPEGWRTQKFKGGILMEVPTGEIIVPGLAMPHSPRLYDEKLYLLNSAHGQLLYIDRDTGKAEIVNRLPGFARGMARCGDYLFIGLSKLRHQHNTFGDLLKTAFFQTEERFCGVVALHLPSGRLVGSVRYLTSCEEIYDVQILPNLRRPGILNTNNPLFRQALATPTDCFWSQS